MASPELTQLSKQNAPAIPKAGDVRSVVDGTTNFYTKKDVASAKVANQAITPSDLKPAPVINVPTPAPQTIAPKLADDLAIQADMFTQQQQEAAKTAETTKTTAMQDYLKSLQASKGITGLTADAYAAKGGVNDITPELNAINDQIRQEQLSLRRSIERINKEGGGLKSGAAAEISNLERTSLSKQADLSIIQMAVQGRYDSAKEIADRAVAANLEQQNIYNETLRFMYNDAKDSFDKTEQRAFETLLGNRERKLEEEKQNQLEIKNFALSALQAGAPTSLAKQAMGAKTMDEALSLVGGYLRPQPKAQEVKPPEIKNFGTSDAPNWKQFNASTGAWEDVSGITSASSLDPKTVSESQAKLDTLMGYTNEAFNLANASGASGLSKFVGNFFVGDTKFNQLSNVTDTLKTNLLTLNTDPAIKKFFGPQMSNRDTELISSAATTLNAANQSPEQYKKEIAAYQDFLNRAKGWTTLGLGNTLTVTLTDPNTKQSQEAVVNYDTLSQAVRDGVQVKF